MRRPHILAFGIITLSACVTSPSSPDRSSEILTHPIADVIEARATTDKRAAFPDLRRLPTPTKAAVKPAEIAAEQRALRSLGENLAAAQIVMDTAREDAIADLRADILRQDVARDRAAVQQRSRISDAQHLEEQRRALLNAAQQDQAGIPSVLRDD